MKYFFSFILAWGKIRVLYYVNNWIYTTNHKRIAVNYFWFVILSGIVGMVLATIIRLELAYPGVGIFAGDSLQYLSMVTAHGVIMVFFMIMPLLFGAFGNFLLPTQLGVHDVAFPRLNSAAFWFLPAGLLMLTQLVCVDRRYQRMNCFNIREVQSLLKRKFFVDLFDAKEFNMLLDTTMLSLKYKINDFNFVNSNFYNFYNFGIEQQSTKKNNFFSSNTIKIGENLLLNPNSYLHKILKERENFSIFEIINYYYLKTSLISEISLNFKKDVKLEKIQIQVENLFYLIIKLKDFFFNGIYLPFFYLKYGIILIFKILNFFKIKICALNIENFKFFLINLPQKSTLFFYNLPDRCLIFVDAIPLEKINSYIPLIIIDWEKIFKTSKAEFFIWTTPIVSPLWWWLENVLIFFQEFATIAHKLKNKNIIHAIVYFTNPHEYEKQEKLRFLYRIFDHKIYKINKIHLMPRILINQSNMEDPLYLHLDIFLLTIKNLLNFIIFTLIDQNVVNFLFFIIEDVYFFLTNWYFSLLFSQIFNNINLTNFEFKIEHGLLNSFLLYVSFFFLALKEATIFGILDFTICCWKISNFFIERYKLCEWLVNFIINKILNIMIRLLIPIVDYLKNPENWTFLTYLNPKTFFIRLKSLLNFFKKNNKINMTWNDFLLKINEEFITFHRNQNFDNIVFKYDYKSGDYFSKLYKENFTYLFTSMLNLTSGLRTAPWFLSFNFDDVIKNSTGFLMIPKYKTYWWQSLFKINPTDGFFNFFCILQNENEFVNKRWISFNVLNQKFYNSFITSSMQQRIYANWRQLKFTREAWRCKLLASRHQKTLFKRYVNEDGIFWSLERNARDLLPGWAMITPFSSRTRFTAVGKVDIGLMGVLLVLNSSIISSANFLVTYRYLSTLNNRKMRDARSFFTEGIMVASWMMIAANPMLVIGIVMLLSDRHWQTSFFDYSGGGDTILFQHMFWFFGHPEVYIIIIPVFGFTNTLISYYLKKRVSARASLLYSMYTIAFLGFFVWGHHMYMVGLAHTTRMLFSTITVMISVPAATKLMHWCVTLANSSFTMELPFLFILTFIFFFVSGGISGMFVAHTGMDVLFHDTFYVIGHFHVMFAGAAMFGSFGAFYFYFPAIFGVKYSRVYAYLHYSYYLVGQLMTVIPMFWLGYAGMPRRVLDYPSSLGGWHSVISAGHMLSVAGLIAFFIMIFDSLRQARAVTRNTFGISRYNTRLNFYIYESSRLLYFQRKFLHLYKYVYFYSLKLNKKNYINFEPLETILFSYSFTKN